MSANSRTIWNGAISFGLVNIPVGLLSATKETGLDFDWIDKRTMDLVGYKRINKNTGEDIEKENIVRGISYEKGKYVILSDEEIRQPSRTIRSFGFLGGSTGNNFQKF